MTGEREPQTAAQSVQAKLHRRHGWLFVPPFAVPGMEELGVVQRFAATRAEYVHEVRISPQGRVWCTCPGWRTAGKCWHLHWFLRHNVGSGWTVCSYVDAAPTKRELAEYGKNAEAWKLWLDAHIAVVGLEDRPRPAPIGIGKRRRACDVCGRTFRVRRDGATNKRCSPECRAVHLRAWKRRRRRQEHVREWSTNKLTEYLAVLEEEYARRRGLSRPLGQERPSNGTSRIRGECLAPHRASPRP